MVAITDKDGRMLPALRNLVTLVLMTVAFIFGWIAHSNWSLRGEADQLIEDAKVSGEIRTEKQKADVLLSENVKNAKSIKQTKCNCGDTTDVEFMRELRKNRKTGFELDGGSPF